MTSRIFTLTGIVLSILSGAQASEGDSLKRADTLVALPYQITFITPMGTNGILSAQTTHNLSLNIVAGYNGGVEGLEVGGFANVIEHDMHGSQFAGFCNVVRGEMEGVQAAGFSNYVHGESSGVMLAGFTNHCNKSTQSVQAAGFSNQSLGNHTGGQIAGFSNVVIDSLKGAQIAGFANYAGKSSFGTQAAGFCNTVKGDFIGPQVAGFCNSTIGKVTGPQVAGFANAAENVEGFQASGFINLAKNVNGTQLSFINVADSFEHGAPIGFLSFVRNGYRSYSLSANEVGWAEFQFRTGVSKFYNIFSVGISPIPGMESWGFGYGIGSTVMDREKSDLALELSAYSVNEKEIWNNTYNSLYRFSVRYSYAPKAGRFAIWGAPSINLQQSAYQKGDGSTFTSQFAPYSILEDKGTYVHSKVWMGAQIGISF